MFSFTMTLLLKIEILTIKGEDLRKIPTGQNLTKWLSKRTPRTLKNILLKAKKQGKGHSKRETMLLNKVNVESKSKKVKAKIKSA